MQNQSEHDGSHPDPLIELAKRSNGFSTIEAASALAWVRSDRALVAHLRANGYIPSLSGPIADWRWSALPVLISVLPPREGWTREWRMSLPGNPAPDSTDWNSVEWETTPASPPAPEEAATLARRRIEPIDPALRRRLRHTVSMVSGPDVLRPPSRWRAFHARNDRAYYGETGPARRRMPAWQAMAIGAVAGLVLYALVAVAL